jgi:hypothetical protein
MDSRQKRSGMTSGHFARTSIFQIIFFLVKKSRFLIGYLVIEIGSFSGGGR